jgi:hypothetical protein
MPDDQLTDSDWLELHNHLVAQLAERGFADVRAAVEQAAAEPIFEESTPEHEDHISRAVRADINRTTMRTRNPEEVFAAGLEVLRARLTELPAVVRAITKYLGPNIGPIEFRLETPIPSEPIPLARLSASDQELLVVSETLIRLGLHAERIKGIR